MGNPFYYDSKVMRFGAKVTDLILLQLVTLLCCIPIFTVGAAFSAMHTVLLKMYRRQDPSVFPEFWKAFKGSFKQAAVVWLIYLALLAFLIVDWILLLQIPDPNVKATAYLLLIPLLLALLSLCWVFVLISRYQNSTWQTVKNSLTLVFRYPLKSLSMLILLTLPIWVFYLSIHSFPFLLLLGVSVPGFLRTIVYSQVFDQLEGTNWRQEQALEQAK